MPPKKKVRGKKLKTQEKVPPSSECLSEYERIRQKNILERTQKLLSLGFPSKAPSRVLKERNAVPKCYTTPSAVKATPPTRSSSRLKRIAPLSSEGIKTEILNESPQVQETILPYRDLSLEEVLVSERNESDLKSSLSSYTDCQRGSGPSRLNVSSLKVNENGVFKVLPNRIFSMNFHPAEDKFLVGVGDKWGNIGLWDLSRREECTHLKFHQSPVNCLTFDKFNPSKLVSTSYDGTVRQLDLNSLKVNHLYGDGTLYTTYHSQIDAFQYLITLGKEGAVGVIDERADERDLAQKISVFPDRATPKTISYKDNLFVVGNNKWMCSVFDIRKTKSSLYDLKGHTGVVTSAFFNPSSSHPEILTTDYNDKIHLYRPSSSDNIFPAWTLYHDNHTGRWLTTFKANWHPSVSAIFVGSMRKPRQINVLDVKGNELANLCGEWLGSICSVIACHPSANVVVGGNSSGRAYVFEDNN